MISIYHCHHLPKIITSPSKQGIPPSSLLSSFQPQPPSHSSSHYSHFPFQTTRIEASPTTLAGAGQFLKRCPRPTTLQPQSQPQPSQTYRSTFVIGPMDPPPRTKREAYRKAVITPLTLTPPPPRPSLFTKLTPLSPSKLAPGLKVASAATECEEEQLQKLVHAPPFLKSGKKRLSKQLSMCETTRDRAWERRRRQMMMRQGSSDNLTDEDMNELKGSIELGFGFKEDGVEGRHRLCNTLPALDLYFAVNRGFSPSPVSTPRSGAGSSLTDSPTSDDSFKICGPGDDPQQVKTKLRHWAQAVACSVMQSF